MNYVIGTGWYCGPTDPANKDQKLLGDSLIRGANFHHLWFETLVHYARVERIIMVDSASVTPPPISEQGRQLIESIRLNINPGHSTRHLGFYSGWMASVIIGIEYALMSNFDYYVYVEQDLLLHGEGIIDDCICSMKKPFLFGCGRGTPQPLQQSFFIVRKDGYKRFLSRLHSVAYLDSVISPEWKFYLSANKYSLISAWLLAYGGRSYKKLANTFVKKTHTGIHGYDLIPFGFGRDRPIDFNYEKYYFQHGSTEELRSYYQSLPKIVRTRIANRALQLDEYLRDQQHSEYPISDCFSSKVL